MPQLYIITGSNGAGKSTVGPDYLPAYIQQYAPVFDGDKLFMQKQRELLALYSPWFVSSPANSL